MSQDREQDASPRVDTILAVSLAAVAGLMRLMPHHPVNLTPLNALGLFGGARLPALLAALVPLAVMAATDVVLRLAYGWRPFDPFVYGALLLCVLLGRLLSRTRSAVRIGAVTLLGSLLFFLVTNLGAWLEASSRPEKVPAGAAFAYDFESPYPVPMIRYARTPEGLAAAYLHGLSVSRQDLAAAPPLGFFGNLVAGDLLFSGLLFGAHALLVRRLARPARLPQETVST